MEQPFELNYTTQAIRGWPKLLVEVWEVDIYGRNSIAGYGQITIPTTPGFHSLEIFCWRPKISYFDELINARSEMVHKDVIICSESRFGFPTQTTGKVVFEVDVIVKDFQFHGVKL